MFKNFAEKSREFAPEKVSTNSYQLHASYKCRTTTSIRNPSFQNACPDMMRIILSNGML